MTRDLEGSRPGCHIYNILRKTRTPLDSIEQVQIHHFGETQDLAQEILKFLVAFLKEFLREQYMPSLTATKADA